MRSRVLAVVAALFAAAAPSLATFHEIKVKEVFPGTVAAPNAQYVVLQAYAAGQVLLTGHALHVFDAAGAPVATFTFSATAANGANQMTLLIATTEAATLFGVPSDLPMTASLPLTGGKVCWEALDCVAWGSYHGPATGVGTPFNAPVGLERGQAMQRRLDVCAIGMPTILEACDDTDDSANDFVFAIPAPKNNADETGTVPVSTCGNSILEGLEGCDDGNTNAGDGCSAVCQPEPGAVLPAALVVDDSAIGPPGANGIFEPGETVTIAPSWTNAGASAVALTGTAAAFSGPAGASYTIADSSASYGSIDPAGTASCATGADCYSLTVSAPATRPAAHWDAQLTEVLSNTGYKTWTLHIGGSFPDVLNSSPFYPYVENLFHNGVTGGCAGGNYCPANSVTRAQMAVFLLKAEHGAAYVPPACGGTFPDVACPSLFADWIERLASEGVTAGCGGGLYCPDSSVTRRQMAVFLLKTKEGPAYVPPAAVGIFGDVPEGDGFAPWIEELYHRSITGGCQAAPLLYCPDNPNTRAQMAVFLVKTFSLLLYGS